MLNITSAPPTGEDTTGQGFDTQPGTVDELKNDTSEEGKANDPNSNKSWRSRIDRTKRIRTELKDGWSDNVDYRRGKTAGEYDDEDRVNVNLDWSLVKDKHAQLYSQTPQVYLTAKQKQIEPAIPVFQKRLNDTLGEANVGAAMDEAIFDAVNAAGFGAILVGFDALTKQSGLVPDRDVTGMDPTIVRQMVDAKQIKMIQPTIISSRRFYVNRISPSDFLWPLDFTGSDFNDCDWIGYSGRMTWAEAKSRFKLNDDDREKILTIQTKEETLRRDSTSEHPDQESLVQFDQIWYWSYRYNPDELSHKRIWTKVFIKGLNKPIVDEAWKGQQINEQNNEVMGSAIYPLQVLTLTYMSDDAIPPSDSAIGRPQVDELIRSRTQIVQNRDRSQPIRWANVNGIDPQVLDTLMRGEFQSIVPVNGDGSRYIGEVARAAYPREDFEFDNVIQADLGRQWGMGPNQGGQFASGRRSAKEAANVQAAVSTRVSYERGKVANLFTNVAQIMGGLLSLFDDIKVLGQDEQQRLKLWDPKTIGNQFAYWIRPDSTVLLDANQRVDKLMKVLNLVGKSGFVNPKPLISEIVELHGLDPAEIIVDPKPPKPEAPNISMRFSGSEDLTNPLVVALLMKSGEGPSPDEIEAAKNLLASLHLPPAPPKPQAPGQPSKPGQQGPPKPGQAPLPNAGGPKPPMMPRPPDNAHPNWQSMPKIQKRSETVGQ